MRLRPPLTISAPRVPMGVCRMRSTQTHSTVGVAQNREAKNGWGDGSSSVWPCACDDGDR